MPARSSTAALREWNARGRQLLEVDSMRFEMVLQLADDIVDAYEGEPAEPNWIPSNALAMPSGGKRGAA